MVRSVQIKKNGFTIVEVLLATVVVSVGLLGAFNLFSFNIHNFDVSGRKLQAVVLAQQGLELAKNQRDSGIPTSSIAVSNFNWEDFSRTVSGNGSNPAVFKSKVVWSKGEVELKMHLYDLQFLTGN